MRFEQQVNSETGMPEGVLTLFKEEYEGNEFHFLGISDFAIMEGGVLMVTVLDESALFIRTDSNKMESDAKYWFILSEDVSYHYGLFFIVDDETHDRLSLFGEFLSDIFGGVRNDHKRNGSCSG